MRSSREAGRVSYTSRNDGEDEHGVREEVSGCGVVLSGGGGY